MIQFEASIIAAWWGAIIASIILLWDMFKWFNKGAKISISATPNMQIIDDIENNLDNKKIIFVEVLNIGEIPTTITHLAIYQYKSIIKKLLNKPTNQGLVLRQGIASYELPHLLSHGHRWTGIIKQEGVSKEFGKSGIFYCGIVHTSRKKPVLARISL